MAIIKENAKKTGFFDRSRFLISDYRSYLRKASGRDGYHLIFIDPPYAQNLAADALERIISAKLAKPGCLIVCESGSPDLFAEKEELASHFEIVKSARYSITHIHILRYLGGSDQ